MKRQLLTTDLAKEAPRSPIVIGVVLLVMVIVATALLTNAPKKNVQLLADGSQLMLNRVMVANKNEFIHGRFLEKLADGLIPTNGAQLFSLKLNKPTRLNFTAPLGKTWLAAEFNLIGTNITSHPLTKRTFYRQFRCMIRGDEGIEYAQRFQARGFQSYADGYHGYILTSRFPRDSEWLWFRIERRESEDQGSPWISVAEFKTRNTTRPTIKPWLADPIPMTKSVKGMDVTLGEITVLTQPDSPRDISNYRVNLPLSVSSNGVTFTNWGAPYIRVEDASGNWDNNFASHRSLDPGHVWKLDMDFQPESALPPHWVATINLPPPNTTITNTHRGQAISLASDGSSIDVAMATNRNDLALRFINATDADGFSTTHADGNWN